MKEKLVVIGNGMGGMRCIEELLSCAAERFEITVFGAEPYGNYNRIMLTPMLAGAKSVEEIMIHDFAWYQSHRVDLQCGPDKTVIAIDTEKRRVTASDGGHTHYDRLLIATGSRSHILPISGSDVQGVIGFRDIADVEYMVDKSQKHRNAVVLGGGLLGLEAANGLLQRGMDVTVVNRASHILNKQLDECAARMLQEELETRGVQFVLGRTIESVVNDGAHIAGVVLDDGREFPADLLVMATGIVPNVELAEAAGLDCGRGIIVDDSMRTSDKRIYAVGECIEHRGELFGLVAPVFEQAKVCARHLAGESGAVFRAVLPATMLKVSGIDLFSIGDFLGKGDTEIQHLIDHARRIYRKIVLRHNFIVGILLYGDTSDSAWYQQLLRDRVDVSGFRDDLVFGPATLSEVA